MLPDHVIFCCMQDVVTLGQGFDGFWELPGVGTINIFRNGFIPKYPDNYLKLLIKIY